MAEVVPAPEEIREAQGQEDEGETAHEHARALATTIDEHRGQEEDAQEHPFGPGDTEGECRCRQPQGGAGEGRCVGPRGPRGRPPRHGGEESEQRSAIAGGEVAETRAEGQERRGEEGQRGRSTVQSAGSEVDDEDGGEMGPEADALCGRFERGAGPPEHGDQDHEQEVGGPVDGRLADVPNHAVPRGQVPRIAQEHGRVFLGPAAEVNDGAQVDEDGTEQERDGEGIDSPSGRLSKQTAARLARGQHGLQAAGKLLAPLARQARGDFGRQAAWRQSPSAWRLLPRLLGGSEVTRRRFGSSVGPGRRFSSAKAKARKTRKLPRIRRMAAAICIRTTVFLLSATRLPAVGARPGPVSLNLRFCQVRDARARGAPPLAFGARGRASLTTMTRPLRLWLWSLWMARSASSGVAISTKA